MTIPKPDDELNVRELVTIRNFRDLHEALLAKGSLESSGIESFLADENMVHMDWLISNLLGGVKLKVDAANAEAASSSSTRIRWPSQIGRFPARPATPGIRTNGSTNATKR